MRPRPVLVTPAAIILAAGASTRLGHPKQLVRLANETLLDRTVRIAGEAGCTPIYVVLGASAADIQQHCALSGATILLNDQWQEGMASSIRLGVHALAVTAAGAILLTCDMPAVTPSHLHALASTGTLTASRYAARNGVPAFFPRATFPQLLALTGDRGASALLASAPSLDLPGGELDLDTPEDLARLTASL